MLSNTELLEKLTRPKGKVSAILDTDTFNEIDDQFAVAYMVLSPEKFDVRAITAAPFSNDKAKTPDEGMIKSYNEILKIKKLIGPKADNIPVYSGSMTYLPDEHTPVNSEAARMIVEHALSSSSDNPLYVIGIAAITNIASALLLCPEISSRIVIVWLGGNSFDWQDTREFNMAQDVAAARVVFNSGAPVVQLPCMGVVSHLTTTGPELTYWLRGKNDLCDYLVDNVLNEVSSYAGNSAWSRVIWDISAIAWFLSDNFTSQRIVTSPICTYDHYYSFDPNRHYSKVISYVNRDAIFTDLFKKLINK